KIRLEGSLENPNTNWLMAIGFILRNAFIQALQPGIDHEINLKGVKGEVAKKGGDDWYTRKKIRERRSCANSRMRYRWHHPSGVLPRIPPYWLLEGSLVVGFWMRNVSSPSVPSMPCLLGS